MFSHSTETFASSLRIGLITIWAIGVGFFSYNGPQPIADALTQSLGVRSQSSEQSSSERVIRVTLAPRAPIRAWQRTAELAREKGALGVGVIGPALPKSESFVTLNPKVPLLEELGLPQDRDGKHRRFRPRNGNGPTFLSRLVAEAGQALSTTEQRIPLGTHATPSITAAQLSALPTLALEGRIVLISGQAPWGTAELPTPMGVLPIAEILSRLLTGNPLASISPWTGLWAFGLGGIFLARLLEAPHRRKLTWIVGLSMLSTAVFGVSCWLGHAFPLDGVLWLVVTSGIFLYATRPGQPAAGQPSFLLQSRETQLFHRTCCMAALQQTGALATWIAVLDGQWQESARGGDAGELPTGSLQRLLDPDAEKLPEDLAILVFPFSNSKPGVLIIQPGDQGDIDLTPAGTAVAHLLGSDSGQPQTGGAALAPSLVEKAWLEQHTGALYDAAGRVQLLHPTMKAWLVEKNIDPDTNLMALAKTLEWNSLSLPRAWSLGWIHLNTTGDPQFHIHRLLPSGGHNGLGVEMSELVPSSDGQAG